MKEFSYLDNAATAPLRPEAAATDAPFGNPSGSHWVARKAKNAIEEAREVVATGLGVDPSGVIFTSGGTESDNLAISGALSRHGGRALCAASEHSAVLGTCLHHGGATVPILGSGKVDLDALGEMLDESVTVVSVMLANNETGIVNDIDSVSRVVTRKAPKALLHCDAVQGFGWLDVARLCGRADMISISAHKFGGPKGAGVLGVRKGVKIDPVIFGGGQEGGLRSGTHNVAGIVGLAAAIAATLAKRDGDVARVSKLRDRLVDEIIGAVPGCVETGLRCDKIAGNAHLRFEDVESEELLVLLDEVGVCASAGSACSSGAIEASHVLLAMGISAHDALTSLRLSLGWATTSQEIEYAIRTIPEAVIKLRSSK